MPKKKPIDRTRIDKMVESINERLPNFVKAKDERVASFNATRKRRAKKTSEENDERN